MLAFLKENWLNLALVLVGASAFMIYVLQKQNEKRAAATKVLLQIDKIEAAVIKLKSNYQITNIAVYKIPVILEYNSWLECGYQFYRSMGRDDINIIDNFFACAAELEKSRLAICHSLAIAWEHKDAELQMAISNITQKKENIDGDIKSFIASFNPRSEIFTANLPIEVLASNLTRFQMLSGTTAYKKLQKISYRR